MPTFASNLIGLIEVAPRKARPADAADTPGDAIATLTDLAAGRLPAEDSLVGLLPAFPLRIAADLDRLLDELVTEYEVIKYRLAG